MDVFKRATPATSENERRDVLLVVVAALERISRYIGIFVCRQWCDDIDLRFALLFWAVAHTAHS